MFAWRPGYTGRPATVPGQPRPAPDVARPPGLRLPPWRTTTDRNCGDTEDRDMTAPDRRLAAIRDTVHAGARLSFDDGVYLDRHADLFTLGELANLVRERKNGNLTYYNVNTHLNPTNVCVYRCTFCSFRADLKSPKGYVMSDEQILERAAEADQRGATELHIVGGLHHQLPYEWYLHVVRIIHQNHPRLHLKAYTAVEWDWFARLTGRPTRDILAEFKDAGLGSLPGGGAEIFHPEVRDKICEHKADADG